MSQVLERFGKHILLEKLASGGMAEVFLARSTGVQGLVKFLAVKRILPQYSDNSEFIKMFIEEAKIIINLTHKNIVTMYEFGKENNRLFLTMDYIEGRNLRQITRKMEERKIKLPIEHVIYIAKEVAAGLDYAHRCLDGVTGRPLNIIHRDISPQNIMVNFEGEVKVVDFGIAKAANQLEQTMVGTLKGKFSYMSTEQANGKSVDHRTDIFSLGVIVWELLSNKRLFHGKDQISVLKAVQACQIPRISQINPFIPPKLEKILMQALSPSPSRRYQRAEVLYKELSRFLNHQFPDFSHHDFADFVKDLFSEDISMTKKKLITYANLSIDPESSEKSLFNSKDLGKEKEQEETISKNEISSKSSGQSQVEVSNHTLFTSVTEKIPSSSDVENKSVEPFENDNATKKVDLSSVVGLSQKTSLSQSSSLSILDIELGNETNLKDLSKKKVGTEERGKRNRIQNENKNSMNPIKIKKSEVGRPLSSSTNKSNSFQKLSSSYQSHQKQNSYEKYKNKSSKDSWIPIFLLSMILLVGYFFFHPNKEVRQILRQHFQSGESTFLSSKNPFSAQDSSSSNGMNQALSGKKEEEGLKQNIQESFSFLIVTSRPSGARIYINGKDTKKSTPNRVVVSDVETFSLLLKKPGYANYRRSRLSLKKMKEASLTVRLIKK